jgi:glycosyltransferase involved in cell wall biosynthesis
MNRVSAYVPFYNNATLVEHAVRSILAQTRQPDQIFAVDDGSTDNGAEKLRSMGIHVVRLPTNSGRGAARQAAMEFASGDWVLSCDATNQLAPDFLERAIRIVDTERTSGAFGVLRSLKAVTTAERWRARHLFQEGISLRPETGAKLSTYACLLNLSAVRAVGGFNQKLRADEDIDMGHRLHNAGYDLRFDPSLVSYSLSTESAGGVLRRYARWYGAHRSSFGPSDAVRWTKYALTQMTKRDLMAGDFTGALMSMMLPLFIAIESRKKSPVRPAEYISRKQKA